MASAICARVVSIHREEEFALSSKVTVQQTGRVLFYIVFNIGRSTPRDSGACVDSSKI